ncbi:MAG: hypothetical protein L3K03_02810 [Thermoplasmata archaeon]|nr:hypothetical protein [Thermoplasmata archaeon]
MSASSVPAHATAPPVSELPVARRAAFAGFAALTILAILFYLWWGLSFGVWIDNGVYAVVITLLLFGVAGMWLVSPNAPTPDDLPPLG